MKPITAGRWLSEEQTRRLAVIHSVGREVLIAGIVANLRANEQARAARARELAKRRAR